MCRQAEKQMKKTSFVKEIRNIPVIEQADICVVGGSCTGVFAAVRAARFGARVVIVEKQNCFGGVATAGLVHVWHSLYDIDRNKQIIAGLTLETLESLKKIRAVQEIERDSFRINTEELKVELDRLIVSERIIPYLHTFYTAPWLKNNRLSGVIVENKSGCGLIKADVFIDATGDGDLAFHLGVPFSISKKMQPPTMCAKILGLNDRPGFNLAALLMEHGKEFMLKEDWGWRASIPGLADMNMHAATHIFNTLSTDARSLTTAEIEGRRQVRAVMDMGRRYKKDGHPPVLVSLASTLGIRDSRRFSLAYRLKEKDVLNGKRFRDAIAYGTYPVDIHHSEKPGITFKNLDGSMTIRNRNKVVKGRWAEEGMKPAGYYQIPYRCMVTEKQPNLIMAGRAVCADDGAFGAIRVMVNANQTGEAAGVAGYLALDTKKPVADIDIPKLRDLMIKGGSILFD
jgi:hypothetical protein